MSCEFSLSVDVEFRLELPESGFVGSLADDVDVIGGAWDAYRGDVEVERAMPGLTDGAGRCGAVGVTRAARESLVEDLNASDVAGEVDSAQNGAIDVPDAVNVEVLSVVKDHRVGVSNALSHHEALHARDLVDGDVVGRSAVDEVRLVGSSNCGKSGGKEGFHLS